jgi:glutamate carboxypeptidase
MARNVEAALVLEPSIDGALKVARKGVSLYSMTIEGRAAHAGLDPERGINATVEVANQVLWLTTLADDERGTTVAPTLLTAGTAVNTVPAAANLAVDVRASTTSEQHRVDAAIRRRSATLAGAVVGVGGGINRPPLEAKVSEGLFALADAAAQRLGLDRLHQAHVGGGSDGNLTAGIGIPTLDGLGAIGGNAHAEGEWVSVGAMPERAALVTELVNQLLTSA